jgi:hypothetical protein
MNEFGGGDGDGGGGMHAGLDSGLEAESKSQSLLKSKTFIITVAVVCVVVGVATFMMPSRQQAPQIGQAVPQRPMTAPTGLPNLPQQPRVAVASIDPTPARPPAPQTVASGDPSSAPVAPVAPVIQSQSQGAPAGSLGAAVNPTAAAAAPAANPGVTSAALDNLSGALKDFSQKIQDIMTSMARLNQDNVALNTRVDQLEQRMADHGSAKVTLGSGESGEPRPARHLSIGHGHSSKSALASRNVRRGARIPDAPKDDAGATVTVEGEHSDRNTDNNVVLVGGNADARESRDSRSGLELRGADKGIAWINDPAKGGIQVVSVGDQVASFGKVVSIDDKNHRVVIGTGKGRIVLE